MNKRILAFSAALIMAFSAAGCSSSSSSGSSAGKSGMFVSEEHFNKDFSGVKDIEDGPLLTISNTTAKAGGIAEVTLSVSNADKKWKMCGIHIVYPDVLKCVLANEADREPEYDTGSALKSAQASVAREWQNNLPDDLIKNKMGSLFFTALCSDNGGKDGDIVTFRFKVPDDAKSGTVYKVDYYYSSNDKTKDMFSNESEDPEFEKYAFSHWTGGTITVE